MYTYSSPVQSVGLPINRKRNQRLNRPVLKKNNRKNRSIRNLIRLLWN